MSFVAKQGSMVSENSKKKLLSLLNSQRSPDLASPISDLFEKYRAEKVCTTTGFHHDATGW
jgi:hypothetical protein